MKFEFKIGNINVEGFKAENISVSGEYSINEVAGVVNLARQILKDAPSIVEDFTNAYLAFNEANEYIENLEESKEIGRQLKAEEDLVKEIANMNVIKDLIERFEHRK